MSSHYLILCIPIYKQINHATEFGVRIEESYKLGFQDSVLMLALQIIPLWHWEWENFLYLSINTVFTQMQEKIEFKTTPQ